MCAKRESEDPEPSAAPEFVVITGMSGAGRSEAMHTFEDLGYFCIDNLPPSFVPQLTDLAALPGSRIHRLAVVSDVRAAEFFDELAGELDALHDRGVAHRVLFLEADDATLVNRFKETRRLHPLCSEASGLADAIADEREALEPIRERADVVIDTTGLRPAELRRRIRGEFITEPLAHSLSVSVASFGFKYGSPTDADIVMDVRFLPNPFYNADLRHLTGLDEPVRQFVLGRPETADFLQAWFTLLDRVMPGYLAEGKSHLGVALGCTGGQHRSVALAEATAAHLRKGGYRVTVSHRDIPREPEDQ
ncbi:MAG: RNase adapter RapZ [Coriobacteriia bacterium]|nr:RNase adapter RapZ [Coriobacteriia bacterium]